ncbi:hypothetical protein Atai01_71280 [Amycolatopsis taiwanensis]|uniref:Uncharacterized protein n=2 Tax=Amycolatopsis taiwanensis TaxID=342230 RepID=A0A9W6VKE0_9PSEU|nr:hypothetical protein Atai01_71280 [Amycolatopsis taiwanensis]
MKRGKRIWLVKPSHLPVRVMTGAFILNSGYTMRSADAAAAGRLHGFASGTYPGLRKVDPQIFVRLLSGGEMLLGAALLIPVIPSAVAGAGLAAFAGGLVGLYFGTPGMRRQGSIRPTEEGLGLAKDVWLLGIGASLVVDDLMEWTRR